MKQVADATVTRLASFLVGVNALPPGATACATTTASAGAMTPEGDGGGGEARSICITGGRVGDSGAKALACAIAMGVCYRRRSAVEIAAARRSTLLGPAAGRGSGSGSGSSAADSPIRPVQGPLSQPLQLAELKLVRCAVGDEGAAALSRALASEAGRLVCQPSEI